MKTPEADLGSGFLTERFWNKVKKTDTCWLWVATKAPNGYGQFWVAGAIRTAHRMSYLDSGRDIPADYQVDHLCRVRDCVRPAHLEAVTAYVNQHRSPITNGGRAHCQRGHAYDEENTYIYPTTGQRKCRTCVSEGHARRTPVGSRVGDRVECPSCGISYHPASTKRHLKSHAVEGIS